MWRRGFMLANVTAPCEVHLGYQSRYRYIRSSFAHVVNCNRVLDKIVTISTLCVTLDDDLCR